MRAALIVLTGCGRLGFDATTADAVGPIDAPPPDVIACGFFAGWTTPMPITELNVGNTDDLGAAVSPDGLNIYFHSFRAGGSGAADLYTATRTTPTGVFGPVAHIDELNSAFADRDPTVTRGGSRIYFNSNRAGGTDNIYYSDRVNNAFTTPVLVPELVNTYGPWVSDDELEAVLSRDQYIERATRTTPSATWTLDGPIVILDSTMDDGWASVGADAREVVFETERTGLAKIYAAVRTGRGQPFGVPFPVVALNSPTGNESDPELSADGRTIYFSSDRVGGQKDIYVSTRTCD